MTEHTETRTDPPPIPTVSQMAADVRVHLADLVAAARAVDAAETAEEEFDAGCRLWAAVETLRDDTRLRDGVRATLVASGRTTGRTDRRIADHASRYRRVGESRLRQYVPSWTGTIGTRGTDGGDDG